MGILSVVFEIKKTQEAFLRYDKQQNQEPGTSLHAHGDESIQGSTPGLSTYRNESSQRTGAFGGDDLFRFRNGVDSRSVVTRNLDTFVAISGTGVFRSFGCLHPQDSVCLLLWAVDLTVRIMSKNYHLPIK